ncbi:phosphoribosyl-dephospho-CoA transferase [Paraburkholderia sp. GAS199]|uniref:malonate decarboxylase holo-ACP synthase n=1 Tax=Paraburkholderia sp. GAS199 TaxID=3035126 RepID=UPI003D262753
MPVCAAPPFAADHARSCDARWRAHDLLRLRRLPYFDGEPDWVRAAFERAPYVVVRRALTADGFLAVGLRGAQRSHRYGTWVKTDDVDDAVTPEALCGREPPATRAGLPAFKALAALQRDWSQARTATENALVWGPTGSTGFELATQVSAVSASSDLDLLIRTPAKLPLEHAAHLLTQLQTIAAEAGVRIDAQLETPAGGVALAEWAANKPRVMARHARGPQLIADPWASAHEMR